MIRNPNFKSSKDTVGLKVNFLLLWETLDKWGRHMVDPSTTFTSWKEEGGGSNHEMWITSIHVINIHVTNFIYQIQNDTYHLFVWFFFWEENPFTIFVLQCYRFSGRFRVQGQKYEFFFEMEVIWKFIIKIKSTPKISFFQ